jgi:hypothetical protein
MWDRECFCSFSPFGQSSCTTVALTVPTSQLYCCFSMASFRMYEYYFPCFCACSRVGSCTTARVLAQKHMARSPTGPGTKSGCTGEDQQQFKPTELRVTRPHLQVPLACEIRSHCCYTVRSSIEETRRQRRAHTTFLSDYGCSCR